MKYTNKLNLPEVFVNYYKEKENKPKTEFRYSVTELLDSTKEIVLKRKFADELEQDISEGVPALIGTAIHEWLENNNQEPGDEKEFKFELPVGNSTLVGVIDVLNRDKKLIKDYKTCSVSKIQKQDFNDWYKQGMAYAYAIYTLYNIKIEKLQFLAIMKDWSKLKSFKSANYPSSPVYTWEYDIKDSDYINIETFIKVKLNDIYNYSGKDCLPDEKWYTGDEFAVYKEGCESRANKVFVDKDEAYEYLENHLNNKGRVEMRRGEYLKCLYYCPLRKICEEGKND